MKLHLALIFALACSTSSYAASLSDKVNQYFAAQKAVEHQHSRTQDVDILLALLTPNATFEHPSFNAVQSKDEYKKGLLYYLGKYGKCDIKVQRMIEGLNAVMVEYFHPCVDQKGNAESEGEKQKLVTLFEFEKGKINLIRHYF